MRRGLAGLVAARHPCGPEADAATVRVADVLAGARFDGLPPIRLVVGWGDPAIRTEQVAREGWPAGQPVPVRIVGGRLFSLGGVPARGTRLALSAGSLAGENDATGGLFVLRHDGRGWRVTGEERHWVT
jgi:hypothetical protein